VNYELYDSQEDPLVETLLLEQGKVYHETCALDCVVVLCWALGSFLGGFGSFLGTLGRCLSVRLVIVNMREDLSIGLVFVKMLLCLISLVNRMILSLMYSQHIKPMLC